MHSLFLLRGRRTMFATYAFVVVAAAGTVVPLQAAAPSAATSPAPAAPADEAVVEFLKQTTVARLTALELGRLALARESTPSVAAYARGLAGEEKLLLERLQALAQKVGVTLPVATNEKYSEKLGRLEAKTQEAFEKQFWDLLAELYERDLVSFEFAGTVQNPDVRQFAIQYREMFERQLAEIKERTKSGNGANS